MEPQAPVQNNPTLLRKLINLLMGGTSASEIAGQQGPLPPAISATPAPPPPSDPLLLAELLRKRNAAVAPLQINPESQYQGR